MRLVHNDTGTEVKIDDEVSRSNGDPWIVTGIQKPHSSASTGRIHVRPQGSERSRTFFPNVFNMSWIERGGSAMSSAEDYVKSQFCSKKEKVKFDAPKCGALKCCKCETEIDFPNNVDYEELTACLKMIA